MHCRVFSSIHGFYPLDASSTLFPSHDNQRSLQALKMPGVGWVGETKPLQIENHGARSPMLESQDGRNLGLSLTVRREASH